MTARDVVRAAGCSVSTVSLVVNGHSQGRVRAELADRVRGAVTDLGYRVNQTARALATGGPTTVGLVIATIRNPFFAALLEGLRHSLGPEHNISLVVPGERQEVDSATIGRAVSAHFAGLVLASPSSADVELATFGTPTVLLDYDAPHTVATSVSIDLGEAFDALAGHLYAHGHTRVAYLTLRRPTSALAQRHLRLEAALIRHQIALHHPIEELIRVNTEDAAALLERRWAAWKTAGVTAIVCGVENHAYGVLSACRRLGITVPGDLSLVTLGDSDYASLVAPPLTAIDLRGEQIGRIGGQALLGGMRTHARSSVAAHLTIRESTGSVAKPEHPAQT